jgi:hypothetical protein
MQERAKIAKESNAFSPCLDAQNSAAPRGDYERIAARPSSDPIASGPPASKRTQTWPSEIGLTIAFIMKRPSPPVSRDAELYTDRPVLDVMLTFIFRCPMTGVRVQATVPEVDGLEVPSEQRLMSVRCFSCGDIHWIERTTHEVLGANPAFSGGWQDDDQEG